MLHINNELVVRLLPNGEFSSVLINCPDTSIFTMEKKVEPGTKLYKKRWWIMTIFAFFGSVNAFQWSQYVVVEDVILDYYGVEPYLVEWTTLSYSFCLCVFIIPWAWALQKYGLRRVMLFATFLNAAGAILKNFSGARDSFMIAFVGQWLVAAGQLGFLPSRVSAVWFGSDEVSTACSIGIVGNQVGVALGFVFPPIFIKMNEDKDVTRSQINFVNYLVTASSVILYLLYYFCWEERPKLPPSKAAMEQLKENIDFPATIKRLRTNKGYILLLIAYGINMGVFCAIAALLNRMILTYYPDAAIDVGWIGLVCIVAGAVGSVVVGAIFDKYGHFKEVSVGTYVSAALAVLLLANVIDKGYIILVYLACTGTGFFMTGYFTVGFEFGAELTYPENEGTSSGILNGIPQVFSILMTTFGSWLIRKQGVISCCYFFFLALVCGAIIATMIPRDYRRQALKKLEAGTEETPPQEMKLLKTVEKNHVV